MTRLPVRQESTPWPSPLPVPCVRPATPVPPLQPPPQHVRRGPTPLGVIPAVQTVRQGMLVRPHHH